MRTAGIDDEDLAMRRRAASAIAQRIAPAILAELSAIQSFVVAHPVAIKADKPILDAARQVADAVTAYDQAKYTGFGEAGARLAIERAARTLKSRLEQREAELTHIHQNNRKPKETSNGHSAD